MHRIPGRILLITAAFALFLVPVAAIAAGGFEDVDDDNVFKADIAWLADAGVTKGCNPPSNTRFCPNDSVTREQMSAFMHRLAINKVVDAKTAIEAENAAKLDGKDSTAFLTKGVYDADNDGIVESAEVKIRYRSDSFSMDMADGVPPGDRVGCVTSPVTLDGTTTVVASGGLSLDPIGISWASFHGYVNYSTDGGSTWTPLNGAGLQGFPPDAKYHAAVPVDAVDDLGFGTYIFAIMVHGANHQAAPDANDYDGSCELTITAYTGQGASIDSVSMSAG